MQQAAELLRDMSQSQSRVAWGDAEDAALMRLGDDPLLLNTLLKKQEMPKPGSILQWGAAAQFPCQTLRTVSFQDGSTGGQQRAYAGNGTETDTSISPFRFTPSGFERHSSLDNEGLHAAIGTSEPLKRFPAGFHWLSILLGSAMLMVFLLHCLR